MRGYASLIGLLAIVLLQLGDLPAEPITVRYPEGTIHGFLAVRTLDGKILAAGDLTQTVRKNEVVSHLVFHFKDGSVDDETATFSQQQDFRLIKDHHVQKGTSFPRLRGLLLVGTLLEKLDFRQLVEDTLKMKRLTSRASS